MHALVIYDDLTKHAWAYREMSLNLRRPAGREAYPGDVFYLHSRLLERAAKMSDAHGGGSMTALPVIETQEEDVTTYIPTNVWSITDGQIILEPGLFYSGVRPAMNVGLSVSRVGGQHAALKQVSGALRLELSRYREVQTFAQFGADQLDAATRQQLNRGARITEMLKQNQYQPLTPGKQIISIFSVQDGLVDDLPVTEIRRFENEVHEYFDREHADFVARLEGGKKLTNEELQQLRETVQEFLKSFQVSPDA